MERSGGGQRSLGPGSTEGTDKPCRPTKEPHLNARTEFTELPSPHSTTGHHHHPHPI